MVLKFKNYLPQKYHFISQFWEIKWTFLLRLGITQMPVNYFNGKEIEDFVTSDDSKSDIQLKDQIHLNNTMMCDFGLRSDQSVNINTIKQKIIGWLHTLNTSFFNTRRRCFLTFHDFLYFQKLRHIWIGNDNGIFWGIHCSTKRPMVRVIWWSHLLEIKCSERTKI